MSELTLTINGQTLKATEGMTILEVAQEAGIDIPTLCHHPKLQPFGACRICMVEITKGKRTRLVTSCVYPAEDGLIVDTESPKVVKIRKMLLEFMLAECPSSKVLQDLARKYDVTKTRFDVKPTFCILCGLCVRYCNEIKGANAVGFVGRGTQKQVMFFPEVAAKACPTCGECFSLCPTGVFPSIYGVAKVPHFSFPHYLWEAKPSAD